MNKSGADRGLSASERISQRIAELGDWRGKTLARMRQLIKDADPEVVEEWKWMGTPIFSHDGIICTGESYKEVVKLTFAKGASLSDPARLFNSSLEGNVRRAIDIREGERVDEAAFKALVRQAVALNSAAKSKPTKKAVAKANARTQASPAKRNATKAGASAKSTRSKPAALAKPRAAKKGPSTKKTSAGAKPATQPRKSATRPLSKKK